MSTKAEKEQQIQAALKAFARGNLKDNARQLLTVLGYYSERRIDLSPNTAEAFLEEFVREKKFKKDIAFLNHWRSVDLLFQLTSDEINQTMQGRLAFSGGRVDDKIIESYLFFAVDLTGDQYTRTQFADITREINKLFDMPVMVLFRHAGCLTLAIVNRRRHKRDESKDVLEKVTLIKDIRFASPHRAHIEILFDLSFDELLARYAFTNFVALDVAWQKTLDTSVLNRKFYQELANWYFWALDHVTFPKGAPKDRDGRDSISLIRMVTRLIFCWFLKEKGLIPDELFHEQKVRALLTSLKDDDNTYYTAILQNLFFATLNTEMDLPGKPPTRRFIKETRDGEESEDHMIHQVWRHAQRIRDRTTFERLLRSVPFLTMIMRSGKSVSLPRLASLMWAGKRLYRRLRTPLPVTKVITAANFTSLRTACMAWTSNLSLCRSPSCVASSPSWSSKSRTTSCPTGVSSHCPTLKPNS